MKTKFFFRSLLIAILALGICSSADAQLKGVLNKAKKAVEKKVEQKVDEVLDGDDQSSTTTTNSTKKTTSTVKSTATQTVKQTAGKTYGTGPEIPKIMAMETPYNDYDESGKYINSLAWGLRKMPLADAKTLAEKLTARAKWDMTTLEQLDDNEDYEFGQKLIKEIKNWQYFYVKIGEIMNLMNMTTYKKDNNGLFYYQGVPSFMCAMHVAGNPASEEGVMGVGAIAFTRINGKAYFCDALQNPTFLEEDELAVAKLDLNMATNIYTLFAGYPLEWCRMTQQGVLKDQFDIYYNKALSYATALKEAIKGNSLDNLEFKPMPKAGGMNASMKAKALSAEKQKTSKEVVDVVVTSNSWEIQKNAAGQPVRRVIYGYSIGKTKYGKMATKVSWAEDYQGGGKYGSLHCYGVGTEYFYVK